MINMDSMSDMAEYELSRTEPCDGNSFVLSRRFMASMVSIDLYGEISCGPKKKPIILYWFDFINQSGSANVFAEVIRRVKETVSELRRPVLVLSEQDKWAEDLISRNPLRKIDLSEVQP